MHITKAIRVDIRVERWGRLWRASFEPNAGTPTRATGATPDAAAELVRLTLISNLIGGGRQENLEDPA